MKEGMKKSYKVSRLQSLKVFLILRYVKKENLFLLTGENTYELQQFLKQWMASSIQKYGEYNVVQYDFLDKPVAELLAELSAPPFFGDGKRIFFLKNFPPPPPSRPFSEAKKQEIVQLADLLIGLPEDSVVVLVVPKPDKRMAAYKNLIKVIGKTYEFSAWEKDRSGALSSHGLSEAISWIQNQAQKRGMPLAHENACFLLEYCGDEPWKLANEIEKISLYASGKEITKEEIRSLCIPTEEMQNFAFSNAFQSGKLENILNIFHQLLASGEAPQAILARDLIATLRQILQVKIADESGASAKEAGLHPFVFSKMKGVAKRFSKESLLTAHKRLLALDIDSKTGRLPVTPEKTTFFQCEVEKILLTLFSS